MTSTAFKQFMMNRLLRVAASLYLCCLIMIVDGFTIAPWSRNRGIPVVTRRRPRRQQQQRIRATPRYGPPPPQDIPPSLENEDWEEDMSQQDAGFRTLLDGVMTAKDPQHIPSLLTTHMPLILSLSSDNGVKIVETILQEAVQEHGADGAEAYAEAIELILTFAENFVETASSMDKQYKELLGRIIRTMSNKDLTASARERMFDELMITERENFTAGFLKHLEGECKRIASAASITQESTRLMDILRTIQTRVLEEMGKELGEAAQVLSQLIGYDSETERKAVLDAGLMVRGTDFAEEMLQLAEEALQGFRRMGADAELVKRVEQIGDRLREFIKNAASGDAQ